MPARSGTVEPPLPENRAGGKPGKTCFGGRRLMRPPKRPRGGGRGEKGCAIYVIPDFGIVSHVPFFLSETIATNPEPFNSKSRTHRYPPTNQDPKCTEGAAGIPFAMEGRQVVGGTSGRDQRYFFLRNRSFLMETTRSRKRIPSKWSISCWIATASNPRDSMIRRLPFRSRVSTSTHWARCTFAV